MSHKKLDILVLFDIPFATPSDGNYDNILQSSDWNDERDIIGTLQSRGHIVTPLGLFKEIKPLIKLLEIKKPDIVFNQCESFRNSRDLEGSIPSLLDLYAVPYTGARPDALALCRNKSITKAVLAANNIPVPQAVLYKCGQKISANQELVFPSICKPVNLEASEGLTQKSLVNNWTSCKQQIHLIQTKYKADVLVEQYIDGRELYVSIMGNQSPDAFPIRELKLNKLPTNTPKFLTYKAKWSESYRRRFKIHSREATLDSQLQDKVIQTCKRAYSALGLTGYARFDLRLDQQDNFYIIEVNPNPSLAKRDEFASSARDGGLNYASLLSQVMTHAMKAS